VRAFAIADATAAARPRRRFRVARRDRVEREKGMSAELLRLIERFTPLGYQRVRIFTCLGGDMEGSPGYFVPTEEVDIYEAFRMFVTRERGRWGNTTDPLTISLLAAARLLIGEVAAADLIVDRLPAEPLSTSVGKCLRAPHHALAVTVPLPQHLKDTQRWAQGTPEQAGLRAWLAEHRERLRWFEQDGVYRFMS
jgi:hypothetical protein